jgi:hypothetical protein
MSDTLKRIILGYPCEMCGKTRRGAHTDLMKKDDGTVIWSTASCPECTMGGQVQHYNFVAHMDSEGNCEAVSGKCPTHGEIKRMFTGPQEPVFQKNYLKWMTGGATEAPPKFVKEI